MTTLAARIADLQARFHAGNLGRAALDQGLAEALAAPAAPGPWLHGIFDGHHDLEGSDDEALRVRLLDGVVSEPALGDAPPPVTRQDLPWLADVLADVRLATGPDSMVLADLHDLRLHDVIVLDRGERRLRIRATLWARVVLGPEELLPPPAAREPEDRHVATDDDGLVVYGPDTRAVEGTGHGEGSGASLGCAALGCVGVPTAVGIGVAVGLVGGPVVALGWLGLIVGAWVLQTRLPGAGLWAARSGCLGAVGLAGLAALCTGALAWGIGRDPCAARSLGWLGVAAVPMMAALSGRSRAALALGGLSWSHGLWLWAAVPEASCAVDPAETGTHLVGVLAWSETRDRLHEATAHDPDADLLAHATEVGGDLRISLDGALRDPLGWACDVPVHLSGALMFVEGDADFTAAAAPHLRRLGRLLRRVDGPIVLEGHGPEAGLSGVRARAVATWLEAEAGIAADRLTPRGLGDTHPVVHDEALAHYNLRVDVRRSCP